MATNEPQSRKDGYLSFEGGVDSGNPASLLSASEVAWAVNSTFRGGYVRPRPGFIRRTLTFSSDFDSSNFRTQLFQGAGTYRDSDGTTYVVASIGGRVFTINILNAFGVTDISIPGDINDVDAPEAWIQQAENWLVVQNSIRAPFLHNGSTSRRSNVEDEVPVGGPMAYGRGRLWVAHGSEYVGGDLVGVEPDSVIKFTENDYIAEGGAFFVESGPITGMAFAANLDTALGEGDLLVGTAANVYAFNAPLDRTTWKNLQYPIQRYALKNYGMVNHNSIAIVNGDAFFRSVDGVRTVKFARRDFTEEWTNTPLSLEMTRAFSYDTDSLLNFASAVSFDERFLMTTQPQKTANGVYHRALVALDFKAISGLRKKTVAPAWEGIWTGLRILRIITATVRNVVRCFIFALGDDNEIEFWELTKDAQFDRDTDDVRIRWAIETRSMAFQTPDERKRLVRGDFWLSDMKGIFQTTVRFRSDLSNWWTNWINNLDCSTYRDCEPAVGCQTPVRYVGQVRSRIGLPEPPDIPDVSSGNGFTRFGDDFQVRFDFIGYAQLKRFRIVADQLPEEINGNMDGLECVDNGDGDCGGDCPGIASCDLNDYEHSIT